MKKKEIELLKLIEYTEIIRVSLAKLGAKYAKNPEKLAISTCYFMIDYKVFEKLNSIQKYLIALKSEDAEFQNTLDDFFEKLEYWDTHRDFEMQDLKTLIEK